MNETRGRVTFYVDKLLKITPRHFETETQCTTIAIHFGEKSMRNLCDVYKPQPPEMKNSLPDFERLLQFLRTLKHDTKLFGNLNKDATKGSKDKSDYEIFITTDCFNRQNQSTPKSNRHHEHAWIIL